jgi:hypothetical protein
MMWAAKVLAKLALARLPAGYGIWQRMGLFRHGAMDEGGYAVAVFRRHFERFEALGIRPGFVGLELGPGDSVASALLARCSGASAVYLVDSGRYARTDMRVYRELAEACRQHGMQVPADIDFDSFDGFLRTCRAEYLTEGLSSLARIPDSAVDVIWSQAVLEHVRFDEFLPTLQTTRRLLSAQGAASHRVDLKDHLAGALNNLRFPHAVWESSLFTTSGFYTNRIRYSQMIKMFQEAGFRISALEPERWSTLPTSQRRMTEPFRSMDQDDLLVSGFDVVLQPQLRN